MYLYEINWRDLTQAKIWSFEQNEGAFTSSMTPSGVVAALTVASSVAPSLAVSTSPTCNDTQLEKTNLINFLGEKWHHYFLPIKINPRVKAVNFERLTSISATIGRVPLVPLLLVTLHWPRAASVVVIVTDVKKRFRRESHIGNMLVTIPWLKLPFLRDLGEGVIVPVSASRRAGSVAPSRCSSVVVPRVLRPPSPVLWRPSIIKWKFCEIIKFGANTFHFGNVCCTCGLCLSHSCPSWLYFLTISLHFSSSSSKYRTSDTWSGTVGMVRYAWIRITG